MTRSLPREVGALAAAPSSLAPSGLAPPSVPFDRNDIVMQLSHFTRPAPLAVTLAVGASAAFALVVGLPHVAVGTDLNSTSNTLVQPQDPALAGGGIDQSLRFGDVLFGDLGSSLDDVLIGRLGVDVLLGGHGDDVLVGGTEHGHPENRDRAFGEAGNDVFLWAPGDGSDFFDGGEGLDTLVIGLAGEVVNGQLVFQASGNQQAGEVFVDPVTGLPRMEVTNSPGFCEVFDASTSATSASELAALDLSHLVRFFARGPANSFAAGTQTTDNGLRVTIHLRNVEVLVCTTRNGGAIEAFNLTVSPPQPIPVPNVLGRLPIVGAMVQ